MRRMASLKYIVVVCLSWAGINVDKVLEIKSIHKAAFRLLYKNNVEMGSQSI